MQKLDGLPQNRWPLRIFYFCILTSYFLLPPVSSLLKIAAYFLATLLLGAILAPPLFWGGHALGGAVSGLALLRETDFQRYFNRAMFLAALLLLWPTVRALRIGSWRELGLRPDPRRWQNALFGFVAAGGLLWLLGIGLWQTGVYVARPRVPWNTFGGFLLTAVCVALVEEAFFRGALFGLVRRTARAGTALVFVAALFAVLHFLKPPPNAVPIADVRWTSGFALLPKAFWQWGDPQLVLGGVTTLFAVGLVLGYARWRTGALSLPIGLHAGWVFGLKTFNKCSRHPAPGSMWIGDDLLHGLAPVAVVLLTGGLVWAWCRRQP